MAVHAQVPFAFFATWIGTVKDMVMFWFQVRRIFKRHGATNMIIGDLDV